MTTDLRALTIRQPYAGAIFADSNPKNVENRSRNMSFRGRLLIHAGRQLAADPWAIRDVERITGQLVPIGSPVFQGAPQWAFGAVIGSVTVTRSHHASDCQWIGGCSPWAQSESWHIELAEPRKLNHPIPAYGKQGLWIPDDDLVAEVRRRLRGGS